MHIPSRLPGEQRLQAFSNHDGNNAIHIANPTIKKENGWYRHASAISPCVRLRHARVIPHPGHGISVTIKNTQGIDATSDSDISDTATQRPATPNPIRKKRATAVRLTIGSSSVESVDLVLLDSKRGDADTENR